MTRQIVQSNCLMPSMNLRREMVCAKNVQRKWSKTHLCKNKQMQVMVVTQRCDIELVEEEFHEAILGEKLNERMELSFHSFMGWSSPTTTKIKGRIGKTNMVILIDSGATHISYLQKW